MPAACAARGVGSTSGVPSSRISPASREHAPLRIFISVDLPAPFSPRSTCTSPRRSSKLTWSLASTPGNRLVIPRSSRTTGRSLIRARFYGSAGEDVRNGKSGPSGPLLPVQSLRKRLELARRLDPAGDDQGPQLVHLGD